MSLLRTPGLVPPSQWQSQPDPEVEPGGRRALGDSALDLEKDPGARTLLCGVGPGSGRRLGVDGAHCLGEMVERVVMGLWYQHEIKPSLQPR